MSAGVLAEFRVLIAPGLHNSGPAHWQSRWQSLFGWQRIVQQDWEQPDLARWSARVDEVRRLGADSRPLIIVAHSFGCLATAHGVARDPTGVAGLLLVAPADPDKFGVAEQLPHTGLPVPSIMIGSSNDPWMAAPRAALWARRWGSRFLDAGALGHINADSGLGNWQDGLESLYILANQAHNNRLAASTDSLYSLHF
ncbi:RBBP9/YdeN family alpha/beta hydrolase [Oxalobacteraceae bacterium A2-2]